MRAWSERSDKLSAQMATSPPRLVPPAVFASKTATVPNYLKTVTVGLLKKSFRLGNNGAGMHNNRGAIAKILLFQQPHCP